MSNPASIAAVTATLHALLTRIATSPSLEDTRVTFQPPDIARGTLTVNQVNIFLYQTSVNPSWRNMDMPGMVRPGETGHPPLALDLHYLITAYGRDNNDLMAHHVLGQAMRILHDNPLLSPDDIRNAMPGTDLDEQVERVRITPVSLSLDEMSKVWTTFQTQYRVSAVYQVKVVLIESTRPSRRPLPVLKLGEEGRGVHLIPLTTPVLHEVWPVNGTFGVELGGDLMVKGEHLEGEELSAQVIASRFQELHMLTPSPGEEAGTLQLRIPDTGTDSLALVNWPAGFYTLAILVPMPGMPTRATNEVPFALAPRVTGITPSLAPVGDILITMECSPRIRDGQRVSVLIGDHEAEIRTITNPPETDKPTTIQAFAKVSETGEYIVRVRVDGVDSNPVDLSMSPPGFAADQKITITP